MLLTGHALWRIGHRTKLSWEEMRIILDEHAYVDLGYASDQKTAFFLFYDGRLREYLVGCVRDNSLVTVLPEQFHVPSLIRKQISDKKFRQSKNLFYDVASPKFLEPCPSLLDVRITIRNGTKCMVDALSVCRIDRTGYAAVSTSDVLEVFASDILHLFRTKNEKDVLAYTTTIEVLLYDDDNCLVTCFQTTVRKFLNMYVTDEVDLTADLRVSYLGDVAVLPLGVIPYAVVRERNRMWHHLAESVEKVIEKCEIRIPSNILHAVKYRLQIRYEGIMLSDWQTMSDHPTLCRILDYHPQ